MTHLGTFFCEGILLPILVRRPNIDRDLFCVCKKFGSKKYPGWTAGSKHTKLRVLTEWIAKALKCLGEVISDM
jgi:hypothetical protein